MEWTIGELIEHASAALSSTTRPNGRVRDVPNERLIRWYSTIGLLDPPLARRGRVALYGRRHLLQLVAVKRRQADGRTIAEIQAELTGATDRALESIADLPAPTTPDGADDGDGGDGIVSPPGPASTTPAPAPAASPSAAGAPRARFWAASPAVPDPVASTGPHPAGTAPRAAPAALVHGVRLAPGVTLVLDGAGHAPSSDDLAEIAVASEALLKLLRDRGLTSSKGKHPC
ncbi:DNA-binding transcriptional MerR regulator [Streptosporangium becharense]|uniref:DNA-binding transcriptional MerR regulator n=1 Tax=Streptosporangium becharense TaxID=1816182 RepID=A0A7W9MF37_9ACTN|nr:MerR family transcriptional regulator [Streptosporangium becharense]MBB2912765.1 DNA-binding transcriptional MerR regulator [Streptosporangium becharense]MBB5818410.1 DNA-binding transcriptional MerR regulator [Streptosporangium becharense]